MCQTCEQPKPSLEDLCLAFLPQLRDTVWQHVFRPDDAQIWDATIYSVGAHSEIDDRWTSAIGDMVTIGPHPHNLQLSTEVVGQVAYSPDGVAPDDHKRRRRLTLGRYLARQWGVAITADIETGINLIIAELSGDTDLDGEFDVLRGYDVTRAYVRGAGCHSCMIGSGNEYITEWFSHFPDKIGLVLWGDDSGRALLWTLDDGRRVLDRIYAGNHALAKMRYAQWCRANNVLCSYTQLDGVERVEDGVKITLGAMAVDERPVPYLDTFMWGDARGVFSNDKHNDAECFQCTEGFWDSARRSYCSSCEDRYDDDELTTVGDSRYCESCLHDGFSYCERCDEWCDGDNFTTVRHTDSRGRQCEEYMCDGCAENCASSCHICQDTWRTDSLIEWNGENVCNSCVENGACPSCECCDGEFWEGDMSTAENDTYCCKDCCKEIAEELEQGRAECAPLPRPSVAPNQLVLPLEC